MVASVCCCFGASVCALIGASVHRCVGLCVDALIPKSKPLFLDSTGKDADGVSTKGFGITIVTRCTAADFPFERGL